MKRSMPRTPTTIDQARTNLNHDIKDSVFGGSHTYNQCECGRDGRRNELPCRQCNLDVLANLERKATMRVFDALRDLHVARTHVDIKRAKGTTASTPIRMIGLCTTGCRMPRIP